MNVPACVGIDVTAAVVRALVPLVLRPHFITHAHFEEVVLLSFVWWTGEYASQKRDAETQLRRASHTREVLLVQPTTIACPPC